MTLGGPRPGGRSPGTDPAVAASTYVDQVAEVLPGISAEAALADGLRLCEEILAHERGADTAVDLVRSHFADRVDLDDDQVVAILQGVLSDVCPESGWLDRPTWC